MYYAIGASVSSLHRESTDSLTIIVDTLYTYVQACTSLVPRPSVPLTRKAMHTHTHALILGLTQYVQECVHVLAPSLGLPYTHAHIVCMFCKRYLVHHSVY